MAYIVWMFNLDEKKHSDFILLLLNHCRCVCLFCVVKFSRNLFDNNIINKHRQTISVNTLHMTHNNNNKLINWFIGKSISFHIFVRFLLLSSVLLSLFLLFIAKFSLLLLPKGKKSIKINFNCVWCVPNSISYVLISFVDIFIWTFVFSVVRFIATFLDIIFCFCFGFFLFLIFDFAVSIRNDSTNLVKCQWANHIFVDFNDRHNVIQEQRSKSSSLI